MEMTLHTPLCIMTYFGYKHNSNWRAPVEILASMIQLIGAIVFIYGENLRGVHNLFPNSMGFTGDGEGPPELEGIRSNAAMVDAWKNASPLAQQANMGVYYYFGFWIANWVWIFVPVYFIYECTMEIAAAVEMRGSVKVLVQNALADPEQFQAALKDEFEEQGLEDLDADEDIDVDGSDAEDGEEDDAEERDEEVEEAFDAAEEAQEEEEEEAEDAGGNSSDQHEPVEEEDSPKPRRRSRKSSKPSRAGSRARAAGAKSRKWGSEM